MILSFPAMRGHMGERDYFVTMMKLSAQACGLLIRSQPR
jgi:hypothetical protein